MVWFGFKKCVQHSGQPPTPKIKTQPHPTPTHPTTVKKGDRVAQMILERICMAPVVEVDTLPETARCVRAFFWGVIVQVCVQN